MTHRILLGDCLETLKTLPDCSVQTCVTSPPYYGLRDYGVDGQIGLEQSPEEYIQKLVSVFREVRKALKDDGTLWLNIGDSYNGSGGAGGDYSQGGLKEGQPKYPGRNEKSLKPKDLMMIPARVALALQSDGWWLRSEIIWHKPNPMPESVTDRPTKSHEMIYLLAKSAHYFYDAEAIKEPQQASSRERLTRGWNGDGNRDYPNGPQNHLKDYLGKFDTVEDTPSGRNKRDVWTVTTKPYKEAHFATFPPDLIEPCILAGSRIGDTVLDPFNGSGTTGAVSLKHHRDYIGCELNPDYIKLTEKRLSEVQPTLGDTWK
jgi:DNA modification methylase